MKSNVLQVRNEAKQTGAPPETPEVFRRLPLETLEKFARHGVVGAQQELRRRRSEQVQQRKEVNS